MSAIVSHTLVQALIRVFQLMVHRVRITECLAIQIGYLVVPANSILRVQIVWPRGPIITMKIPMYVHTVNYRLNCYTFRIDRELH